MSDFWNIAAVATIAGVGGTGLGGTFDAGDTVSGEYVFPSPSCRQPGYSRSVYRSACPGLVQTQVSAQAGLRRVEAIVQKGQMTRRTVRFRRNVNFEKP